MMVVSFPPFTLDELEWCFMVRLFSCVLLASLVSGCAKPPAEAPPTPPVAPPTLPLPALEPSDPSAVNLPAAAGAKLVTAKPGPVGPQLLLLGVDPGPELDFDNDRRLTLNVNDQGQVFLHPDDRSKDPKGSVPSLENAEQLRIFLARQAREDFLASNDSHARSVLVLRVDARAPFEKTHAVIKAAGTAGYSRFRLGAVRPSDGREGQIATVASAEREPNLLIPSLVDADEAPPAWYRVMVTSSAAGNIAKIRLRDENAVNLLNEDPGLDSNLEAALPELDKFGKPIVPPPAPAPAPKPPAAHPVPPPNLGADLGPDVEALQKQLKDIRAKNKRVVLVLAIDAKLLQSDVIRLIDASVGAGIVGPYLVLGDKSKQ